MDVLKITKKDLEKCKVFAKSFEAIIYEYVDPDTKETVLLKIYYDRGNLLDLNLEKAQKVHEKKLENVTQPEKVVEVAGERLGFSMKKYGGVTLSASRQFFSSEQIMKILKKVRKILSYLHQNGIVYGDLNPTNILTDGEEVYLTDIVSAQIDNYPFSEKSESMIYYLKDEKRADEHLDGFMLNLLTVYMFNYPLKYKDIIPTLENVTLNYLKNDSESQLFIHGVTDNLDGLDVIFDMFSDQATYSTFLLDHLKVKDIFSHKK